jgi:hypothetical protein
MREMEAVKEEGDRKVGGRYEGRKKGVKFVLHDLIPR